MISNLPRCQSAMQFQSLPASADPKHHMLPLPHAHLSAADSAADLAACLAAAQQCWAVGMFGG
jgi:hypothetical protein